MLSVQYNTIFWLNTISIIFTIKSFIQYKITLFKSSPLKLLQSLSARFGIVKTCHAQVHCINEWFKIFPVLGPLLVCRMERQNYIKKYLQNYYDAIKLHGRSTDMYKEVNCVCFL